MTSDNDKVNEMDAQIARAKFSTIVRNSLVKCVSEAPAVWNGPNGEQYVYEQSLFERNTKPLMWGIGCTLISFFSFRLNASRTFQKFRHEYIRKAATPPPPAPSKAATSPLEQRKELQHELMNQAISIPKDLLLSIAIGVSATAFLLDWTQIHHDLERVPGLPGRSFLADTMCPEMIDLYKNMPPRVWDQQGDETLQSISTIVRNCERRAKVEAAERKRLGLAEDQPVSVPFPGFV